MSKSIYICLVSFLGWSLMAQSQKSISDTIKIDEVIVTTTIPLSDAAMVNRYQTQYTSSIDKINSRLGVVSLISRGAYAMEPSLNSFTAGQINVSIDGMKMFGACTDKMDPITSYIEPVNLKSIELSQGSGGSIYGSTVGGAYNMILQTPKLSELSVETGSQYESVSSGNSSYLKLNVGKSKWAYLLSGNYKKYDVYTEGSGQKVPFTQYEKFNILQSFIFQLFEGHQIKLDVLIDNAYNVGYPALPMDVSKAQGRIYSLDYQPENDLWKIKKLKAKLYANTVYHLMDDSYRDSLYFVENKTTGSMDSIYMKMDMPGWSNTYGSYLQGVIPLTSKDYLTFKVDGYLNWSKAEMTMFMNNLSTPGEPPMYTETWPENQRLVTGLYLKNSHQINEKWNMALDARFDYSNSSVLSETGIQQFGVFGYDVRSDYQRIVSSANLTGQYFNNGSIRVKGLIGIGERLPTLTEQFGFFLYNAHDGYDYIGNPDIRTEKSMNANVVVNYSKSKVKVSVETYYYHIRDYILGVKNGEYDALNFYASGVKLFNNIDWVNMFSANIQFNWNPDSPFEVFNLLKFNYGKTYQHSPMPLIAPLKDLLTLAWNQKNYFIQSEVEYSAAQNRIDPGYGEIESKSFALFNFRAGYNWNVHKSVVKLNAGIENVFNKAYSEHLDWGNYNRPSRNIYFGLFVSL